MTKPLGFLAKALGHREVRVAATLALLAGSTASAQADARWGCEVVLCLASPGGPTQYAACVPPITRLWSHLRRGGAFPTCSGAGYRASQPGFHPYESCASGYTLRLVGEATGAGEPVCVSDRPVRACNGVDDLRLTEAADHLATCEPYDVQPAQRRAKPNFIDVTVEGGPTTRMWF